MRREEGLCIFLYLWQTAVLAWFKLPWRDPHLSLLGAHRTPLGPPAEDSSQPMRLCSGWAASRPPPPNNQASCSRQGFSHFHQIVVSTISQ